MAKFCEEKGGLRVVLLKIDLILAAIVIASAAILYVLLVFFDEGGVSKAVCLGVWEVVSLKVEEFFGRSENGDGDRVVGYISHILIYYFNCLYRKHTSIRLKLNCSRNILAQLRLPNI